MVAKLTDAEIAARLAETNPCKNCGRSMPAWKFVKRGERTILVKRTHDFCSTTCARLFMWADEEFRSNLVPKLITTLRKAQQKTVEWHKSEDGRKQKSITSRRKNKSVSPENQKAAVSLLSNIIVSLGGSAPEIPVKIDKRYLRKGGDNPNAIKVVRLSDGKVYDCAKHAALDVGRSLGGMSTAMKTGSTCKGDQFMRYDEWLDAGKPSIYPRHHPRKQVSAAVTQARSERLANWARSDEGREFHRERATGANNPASKRVVRLSDQKIFETVAQAVSEIDGHSRGMWAALSKGYLHRGEAFMDEKAWIESGKPAVHPMYHGKGPR